MPVPARDEIANEIFDLVDGVRPDDFQVLHGWRFKLGKLDRTRAELVDLLARSIVLAKLGDREAALADAFAVHGRRYEGSAGVLANLSRLFVNLGHFDEAIATAKEFIRKDIIHREPTAVTTAILIAVTAGSMDVLRAAAESENKQSAMARKLVEIFDNAGAGSALESQQREIGRLVKNSMCAFSTVVKDLDDGSMMVRTHIWSNAPSTERRRWNDVVFASLCEHYDLKGIVGDPLGPLVSTVFLGMPREDGIQAA